MKKIVILVMVSSGMVHAGLVSDANENLLRAIDGYYNAMQGLFNTTLSNPALDLVAKKEQIDAAFTVEGVVQLLTSIKNVGLRIINRTPDDAVMRSLSEKVQKEQKLIASIHALSPSKNMIDEVKQLFGQDQIPDYLDSLWRPMQTLSEVPKRVPVKSAVQPSIQPIQLSDDFGCIPIEASFKGGGSIPTEPFYNIVQLTSLDQGQTRACGYYAVANGGMVYDLLYKNKQYGDIQVFSQNAINDSATQDTRYAQLLQAGRALEQEPLASELATFVYEAAGNFGVVKNKKILVLDIDMGIGGAQNSTVQVVLEGGKKHDLSAYLQEQISLWQQKECEILNFIVLAPSNTGSSHYVLLSALKAVGSGRVDFIYMDAKNGPLTNENKVMPIVRYIYGLVTQLVQEQFNPRVAFNYQCPVKIDLEQQRLLAELKGGQSGHQVIKKKFMGDTAAGNNKSSSVTYVSGVVNGIKLYSFCVGDGSKNSTLLNQRASVAPLLRTYVKSGGKNDGDLKKSMSSLACDESLLFYIDESNKKAVGWVHRYTKSPTLHIFRMGIDGTVELIAESGQVTYYPFKQHDKGILVTAGLKDRESLNESITNIMATDQSYTPVSQWDSKDKKSFLETLIVSDIGDGVWFFDFDDDKQ